MRRHLAAVMFTDLVGYTSTVRRDEEAGRRVRSLHRKTVEEALGGHDGTLLQYFGDGSLSIFPSAVEAAAAALEIQKKFLEVPDASLRIGIELGDIAYDEQGAYGDAVNVASRLESLSEPGAILISGKIHQELQNHPRFEAVNLGEVRLRNIDVPIPIYALRDQGLPTLADPERIRGVGAEASGPSGPRPVEEVVTGLFHRTREAEAVTSEPPFSEDPLHGVLPLVGREEEMSSLLASAERVESGAGQTILLCGDRGVGKTRIAQQLAKEVLARGWLLARGQAYPTEYGVPFAPFADAFGAILSGIERSELRVLTQGGEREMAALWPPLGRGVPPDRDVPTDPRESRSRLFWSVMQFVSALADYRPLLLVLEDLQWSDESSLDLLHFLARQVSDKRVFLLCPFCETEVSDRAHLGQVTQSLLQTRAAKRISVGPLSPTRTTELVTQTFGVGPAVVDRFSERLFAWTQGNSFFLEGALRGLIETGQLRQRQGRWLGWEVQELEIPRTVRDAILLRIDRLSTEARRVADLAAVMGGQVTYIALRAVTESTEESLLSALGELTRRGVLRETDGSGAVTYGFTHPLIPETMEAELSRAVTQSIHSKVARALEAHFGAKAGDHVDELAYHFARASEDVDPTKAAHYLAAAGVRALDRNAHSEAARYLEAALARHRGTHEGQYGDVLGPEPSGGDISRRTLLEQLARARTDLGDAESAIELWKEALELARAEGDGSAVSHLLRRIGRAHSSQGRLEPALEAFHRGKAAAEDARDREAEARLCLVEGICLQQAGLSEAARKAVERAQAIADDLADRPLLARVNRGLLLIHMWNGELDLVRERGMEVRAMASDLGDPQLSFWSEWTLAATDGLRGDTEGLRRRVEELDRIADRLRSPTLRLWVTELSLEYAYATGAWDYGIGIGEQAVTLGRALNQNAVLPRILVWLSLIYLGRGDLTRGGELVSEAWEISGAEGVAKGVEFLNVHTVVPAHIGMAAYLSAKGEWARSIEVARAGLDVADRTGYVIWGIHHLLPVLAVAHLHNGEVEEAEAIGAQLRAYGEGLDHDLARAWAGAAEALVAWLRGDAYKGARLLRKAAQDLEEIPMVFDSARVRRQLIGPLVEIGDREGALHELTEVYRVFEDLGAEAELARTLSQFGEYGFRVPISDDSPGDRHPS